MRIIKYFLLIMLFSFNYSFSQMQDLGGQEEGGSSEFQDLSEPEKKLEIKQKADGSLERPKDHDEAMKYYKDKYYDELEGVYFEDLWNAVISALSDQGCELMTKVQKTNDEGFLKGVMKSEFCVFVNDETTFDALRLYSVKMPVIRGGIWVNGRIQYKIILEEINEGEGTSILVTGELSGSEENVTNEVHFWASNGWFETDLLYRIKKKVGR
ncbi:MAG: hypothetical protein R2863_00425 [Candidatus Kapaibacterium sp.]